MFTKKIIKIALLLLAFQNNSQCSEPSMEGNSQAIEDKLYKKALEYRDLKIEGCTKEYSLAEAEDLFWTLANQGHTRAIHNYALMQYNKKKYELAYEWFQKSDLSASKSNCEKMLREGKIKQDLYLVLGSTRLTTGTAGPIIDAIYGKDKIDMSHIKTFDGKATTMDLMECKLPHANHIVGDARKFNFSKFNIKNVFVEKLSTSDLSIPKVGVYHNYLGGCIENISKSMKPGTSLDIEWLPYVTLCGHDQPELDQFNRKNPFHGMLNHNVALQGIFILGGDVKNRDLLPEGLKIPTDKMVKEMGKYLTFYFEQGVDVSFERLVEKVYFEARIILDMIRNNSMIHINFDPRVNTNEELIQARKTAIFDTFPNELLDQKITFRNKDNGEEIIGIVYNQSTFMRDTFFNFLLEDIAAEMNGPYVKDYLESIGFTNISIIKTQNPHNGRKNVWMIKAVKG